MKFSQNTELRVLKKIVKLKEIIMDIESSKKYCWPWKFLQILFMLKVLKNIINIESFKEYYGTIIYLMWSELHCGI